MLFEVRIPVDTVDDPPSVTLTAPATGAYVSGTIELRATASDDEAVSTVEFLRRWDEPRRWDAVERRLETLVGPRPRARTPSPRSPRTASVRPGATHAFSVDNTTPTVSITSPADGATVTAARSR